MTICIMNRLIRSLPGSLPGGKIIREMDMRPKSKAELLESTYTEREKLEQKIAGLTPVELVYPGTHGGVVGQRHLAAPGGLGTTLDQLV